MDPDPGGQKTFGSGGSGSATLVTIIKSEIIYSRSVLVDAHPVSDPCIRQGGFYFLLLTFADPDPAFHSDAASQIDCTRFLKKRPNPVPKKVYGNCNNCDLESFFLLLFWHFLIVWALIKCALFLTNFFKEKMMFDQLIYS